MLPHVRVIEMYVLTLVDVDPCTGIEMYVLTLVDVDPSTGHLPCLTLTRVQVIEMYVLTLVDVDPCIGQRNVCTLSWTRTC